MHANHEITHLIHIDPKKATEKVLAVLESTGMNRKAAAEKFGCVDRTLVSWITQLGLTEKIEAMTKKAIKEGWHHGRNRLGGRPEGTLAERCKNGHALVGDAKIVSPKTGEVVGCARCREEKAEKAASRKKAAA